MRRIVRRNVAFGMAAAAAMLGALPASIAAQEQSGTITGDVIEAGTQRPLAGAQVFIPGSGVGTITNGAGRFVLLNVPAGQVLVRVQMLGFATAEQQVSVGDEQTATVDFELQQSAIALEEVVVTGAGAATERRKLGNTIATVNVGELENQPIQSFSELIQAREPGVVALPSSGLTGEGARLRIRGTASLAQSNQPLVYVDGVRVDSEGGRGMATDDAALPSRLDDIDPSSIERIEILKGPAAATLYGSEASAGVVQIFTKRGRMGAPRWTFRVDQGVVSYPDVIPPNAGFVDNADDAERLSEWWGMNIQPYEVFERDFISPLFETGYSSAYSGSVTGGTGGFTYFVSGRYQYEDGPIGFEGAPAEDVASRAQGTATVSIAPTDNFTLRVTSLFTQAKSDGVTARNNIYSPITLAMFGQPQLASCTTDAGESDPIPGTGRCAGIGNPYGQATFATVAEGFQRENQQEVDHFIGSMSFQYQPLPNVGLETTFGVDAVNQQDVLFYPYGHNIDGFTTNNIQGSRSLSDRNHRELTVDSKLSWTADASTDFSSQFTMGGQVFAERTEYAGGDGTEFPAPGFQVGEAANVQELQELAISQVSAGFFAEEQLGWRDYLFATVGARYDYHSTFGEAAGGQFYPKVNVSFVPSDMPGWDNPLVSSLRLRAAVGQSGLQPAAFAEFTTFGSIRSDAIGAGISPDNLGNDDLRPEISTEWEIGAEVGLWEDRLALDVTYWDRNVKDAIVQRQFPVTGGFQERQLFNIGQLESRGVELNVQGLAYNSRNVQVNVFANAAYLNETLADMGGAPPLKVGGSYPRYRNWLREGYAPGSFFGPVVRQGTDYPIDVNGDCAPDTQTQLLDYFGQPRGEDAFAILLEGGDPRPCSEDKGHLLNYLGKPNPDWAGAFGGNITLFGRFDISSLFEYKAGNFYVHNLTDAFRRSHPSLGGNLRGAVEAKAILQNPNSSAEERLAAALDWANNWAALTPYDGLNEVEEADFIRWRELSLTYNFPATVAQRFGAASLSVTASGRNLLLWTKYGGNDPEINLYGAGDPLALGTLSSNFATGIDAFGLPLQRRYMMSVRVGF